MRLHDPRRGVVRSLAFVRKEIVGVVRQPKLLVTLVLGPFLILALFGAGYRNSRDPLRTIAVASEGNPLRTGIEEIAAEADQTIDFLGIMTSEDEALRRLQRGEADLVVVVPEDPEATIRSGERAEFVIWHDEVDPISRTNIVFVSQDAVQDFNERVLEQLAAYGQEESERLDDALPAARNSAAAVRAALEGEPAMVDRELRGLEESVRLLDAGYRPSAELFAAEGSPVAQALDEINAATRTAGDDTAPLDERIAAAGEAEALLEQLDADLGDFQRIPPKVLVSPFDPDPKALVELSSDPTAFYAPGVVALLLQHLAVTFAALSLVRERMLGTVELFRAAPVTPGETLAGKTTGYLAMGAVIAAALSAMMLLLFDVPMRGSWLEYVVLMLLVLLSSIGLGFVISALADTDTQAVQYSMISLLAAIFFSGFFLTLDRLHPAVRPVSKLVPVSYAIEGLQDVMFRGIPIDADLLLLLSAYALATFLVAWVLTRRRFAAA